MNKRLFTAVFALSVIALAGVQAEEFDGGYAGSFLQVPIGARPTAMGGAYIAVSDDGAGPLYNPAGLSNLQRPLFGSSYRFMQLDRRLGYATLVFPVQGQSALGAQWLYAGSGSVEARDSDGDLRGFEFSHDQHQFTVLFTKRWEKWFSAGVDLNYLYSKMSEISVASVGFDFGAMIYIEQFFSREERGNLPVQDLQVGITVKNIAKEYRWNSEKLDAELNFNSTGGLEQNDKFPVEVGLGVSGRLLKRHLLLAVDVLKNEEQDPEFHAGGEYYLNKQFALRTGFSNGQFTAGTGYAFTIDKLNLLIDYAFTTERADEGSEHIFSFDLQF